MARHAALDVGPVVAVGTEPRRRLHGMVEPVGNRLGRGFQPIEPLGVALQRPAPHDAVVVDDCLYCLRVAVLAVVPGATEADLLGTEGDQVDPRLQFVLAGGQRVRDFDDGRRPGCRRPPPRCRGRPHGSSPAPPSRSRAPGRRGRSRSWPARSRPRPRPGLPRRPGARRRCQPSGCRCRPGFRGGPSPRRSRTSRRSSPSWVDPGGVATKAWRGLLAKLADAEQ